MFIHRIRLKSFRCFDQADFVLAETVQTVSLGRRGGKTSLCRAVQTAFLPVEQAILLLNIRHRALETSVSVDFQLNGKDGTITKTWTPEAVQLWSVHIADKYYDLSRPEDLTAWIAIFLQHAGYSIRELAHDLLYHEIWKDLYTICIQLISGYPLFDSSRLADERFWLLVAGYTDAVFVHSKTARLKNIARQYDENTRQQRYLSIVHQKQSENLNNAISDLSDRIQQHQTRITDLQKQHDQQQTEMRRWQRIREYIDEKEKEIEKLNFEIATYESFLTDAYAEVSENEYRELEKQKKQYDAIQKTIQDLEGRIIERRHMENNLANLLKEIEALEQWIQSGHTSHAGVDFQKQLLDYRDEIKKIRQYLKKNAHLDKELEEAHQQLSDYRRGSDQFEILEKLRLWSQQNNRKSVLAAVEQAKKNKNIIITELQELHGGIAAKKEEECRQALKQTENLLLQAKVNLHQLQEQHQILSERYRNISGQMKTVNPFFSTHTFLTMTETLQLTRMTDCVYEEKKFLSNELFAVFTELQKKMGYRNLPEQNPVLQKPDWEKILHDDYGLSHSEKEIFLLVLRLILLKHFSNLNTLLADMNLSDNAISTLSLIIPDQSIQVIFLL